jgi:hypothetical protein
MNVPALITAISAVNNLLTATAPLIAAIKTLREDNPDLDLPPTPTLDDIAATFQGRRTQLLERNAEWFAARNRDINTGELLDS